MFLGPLSPRPRVSIFSPCFSLDLPPVLVYTGAMAPAFELPMPSADGAPAAFS
jgi:hypothetical protein